MDNQMEVIEAKRRDRRRKEIRVSIEYGLVGAVEALGGTLRGFSVRMDEYEVLMTIRATFEGKGMIGFVGAEDLGACLVKAVRELRNNKVTWRADKYARAD